MKRVLSASPRARLAAAAFLICALLMCSGCSAVMKTAVEGTDEDGNAVNERQSLEYKIAENLFESVSATGATVAPLTGYWRDCSAYLTQDRAQWIMTTTVTVPPADPASQLDPLYQATIDAGWKEQLRYANQTSGNPRISAKKLDQVVTFDAIGTSVVTSEITGDCIHSTVFGTADYPVQPAQ